MTKKDFQLIASALADARKQAQHGTMRKELWNYTVTHMVAALQSTNPRFDAARFVAACGGYFP